jgi:hypothetical protein
MMLEDTDVDAAFPPEAVQSFRDVLAGQLPAHPDERQSAFRARNRMLDKDVTQLSVPYRAWSAASTDPA